MMREGQAPQGSLDALCRVGSVRLLQQVGQGNRAGITRSPEQSSTYLASRMVVEKATAQLVRQREVSRHILHMMMERRGFP